MENLGRHRLLASLGGPPRRPRLTASLGGPRPEGSTAYSGRPARNKGNSPAHEASDTSDWDDCYPSSSAGKGGVEATPLCKRHKLNPDEAGPSDLSCFDPAALVKSSEGTFKAPKTIRSYLDKHFK